MSFKIVTIIGTYSLSFTCQADRACSKVGSLIFKNSPSPPSYGTKLSNQYHFTFTRSLHEASLHIRASLPSLLAPASSRTEQGLYRRLYYVPHVVPGYAAIKYLVNKHTISNTFCALPPTLCLPFPDLVSLYRHSFPVPSSPRIGSSTSTTS